MESDSVRSLGDNTLVDLWIEGKFRAIVVSRQAIESFLSSSSEETGSLTDDGRREFVRTHLAIIVKAAAARLRADPVADTIVIDAGQLGGAASGEMGERRTADRRKGERRKRNVGPPGGVERRRR